MIHRHVHTLNISLTVLLCRLSTISGIFSYYNYCFNNVFDQSPAIRAPPQCEIAGRKINYLSLPYTWDPLPIYFYRRRVCRFHSSCFQCARAKAALRVVLDVFFALKSLYFIRNTYTGSFFFFFFCLLFLNVQNTAFEYKLLRIWYSEYRRGEKNWAVPKLFRILQKSKTRWFSSDTPSRVPAQISDSSRTVLLRKLLSKQKKNHFICKAVQKLTV